MFTCVSKCKNTGRPWVTAALPQLWHPALEAVSSPGGIDFQPCAHCTARGVCSSCACPASGPCAEAHSHAGPWAGGWIQPQVLPICWEQVSERCDHGWSCWLCWDSSELDASSRVEWTLESQLFQANSQQGEEKGHLTQGHCVSVCFSFCVLPSKSFQAKWLPTRNCNALVLDASVCFGGESTV